MKKLLLLLIFGILLVGTVSAFEFDNTLKYEKNDLKVTIKNAFGLPLIGNDIGSAELKSHASVDEVLQFGFGKEEVVMYYDFSFSDLYKNGLGEVYFTDERTGKIIDKDFTFVYWGETERDILGKDCIDIGYFSDGSIKQECDYFIKGKESYETWLPYDSKDIPKGNIRIGLKTYVDEGDFIDGIWTIAGKKIEKHATWTADLNVNIIAYYKFDENAGTTVLDSVGIGAYNTTFNGTPSWCSGIINSAMS